MQIQDLVAVGENLNYRWPSGNSEPYAHWVRYQAVATDGTHDIQIGFGMRPTYGRDRRRIVVWIDNHPHVEFLGTDDFERTGDVVAEIKVPGDKGERMCRYPEEAVPERYAGLPVVGLPTRVSGPGVHQAWAVIANVADHRTFVVLAALRRLERNR